jgi:hypothetical protein
MKTRYFPSIRNAIVAAAALAGLALPADAAPFAGFSRAAVQPAASEANAVQVDYRRYNSRRYSRHNCYRYGGCGRYGYRNDGWRHRNYRQYRRYYPGLSFGLGVAPYGYYYAQPRRYYRRATSAHIRWCYNRYRSYREWDNTFQPYHGPRRQCWSPYS